MSHLAFITYISYLIWSIENHFEKDKYDIFEMMFKALYHDIPEAITWDIITPTKKAVEWFEEILEMVEANMLDDFLFSYVWDEYKSYIKDYMLNPWSWNEWPLVKSSDLISALFEAKIEVNHGSTNYTGIYRNIKRKVNKFDYKSIDYILKQTLDSFDDTNHNMHL
jgi:putative hydrolase of HD superfamily